ncbi:MAG: hypothetical protein QGM46_06465 [Actinomycetota bacterium]|nr:hypothetical protein [Actinomycetota bacterium]MDK1038593.1 hypothetical protein [Actinomycetota bacterium]MDK1096977.1 hypothetical protein [Actinomycetota bacterium]MDK1291976.1 hypothetical protein [Actinomycetota bacterium]
MTTAAPPEVSEFPEPPQELPQESAHDPIRETTISKWYVFALIAAPTLLIFLTMSGVLGPILREGQSLWRIPYLFVANTPTGGDMGAHVLLPKVLLENVLASGRILGWSMDWYAGFPVLYFYFPLPALATVAFDLALPYGVAFKLVTILGLVALPTAAYFFVRFLGFTRFVAAIAGVAGSLMVFMESYSIFGANIKSTLAGMFSFSISFALSILYIGLVVRSYRQGRKLNIVAGVILGLTALSHVISTIIAVIVVAPLVLAPLALVLVDRARAREAGAGAVGVVSSWMIGFGVSAFFSIPLGVNTFSGMTSDMGWAPVTAIVGNYQGPGSLIPGELVPILVLGFIGMMWTMLRRDSVGIAIWMTLFPVAGYFLIAVIDLTVLYNARLLPYWYFGLFTFAGIAIALFATAVGRQFVGRDHATLVAGAVVVVLMVGAAALSMHDLPGWVKWNYEGYEGKAVWSEYENLMETVDELPPGRIMWEANSDMNKYGTPMALMLFPYWSEGHPSMEGLFFESSLTTPFHFLNAAEVSRRPSNPVRGLNYHGMDFDRAAKHLAVYDVAYYVSYTDEARTAAEDFGLEALAEPEPWTIFALPDAGRIDIAAMEPVVWAGEESFVDAALEWYDDVDNLDSWLVEDGPAAWRRVASVDERLSDQRPYSGGGAVELNTFEDYEVSFTTTAIGVPHLVKVSYFPNWTVEGAEGVYRVAPSLMLVVPTQAEVTLQFKNRWVENLGMALTAATLLGLAAYGVVVHRRRKKVAA